jgi:hypothetical protein
VALELATTPHTEAGGPSPDVWQAAPFSRAGLLQAEPEVVGTAALARGQGSVATGSVVSYTLPTSVVSDSRVVALALLPTAADGVGFWNRDGESPPRLIVDLE